MFTYKIFFFVFSSVQLKFSDFLCVEWLASEQSTVNGFLLLILFQVLCADKNEIMKLKLSQSLVFSRF